MIWHALEYFFNAGMRPILLHHNKRLQETGKPVKNPAMCSHPGDSFR
jgi:hypothetical protein